MQNNFKKTPLFLSIALLLFSCAVFFYMNRVINNKVKASEQILGEWQKEASRREEIRSLYRSIKTIEKQKSLIETHFAQGSNIVPFLDTIENLAPKTGAKAEITSVDIAKDNAGLMVGIKASGSFEAVYKFLLLLENSPYELEFISMNMQKIIPQDVSDKSKKLKVPLWDAVFKIKLLSFIQ